MKGACRERLQAGILRVLCQWEAWEGGAGANMGRSQRHKLVESGHVAHKHYKLVFFVLSANEKLETGFQVGYGMLATTLQVPPFLWKVEELSVAGSIDKWTQDESVYQFIWWFRMFYASEHYIQTLSTNPIQFLRRHVYGRQGTRLGAQRDAILSRVRYHQTPYEYFKILGRIL